jgi:tight adherence protein B
MSTVLSSFGLVLVPLLYGLCFAGLGYSLMAALKEGTESYSKLYAADASRQFEDMFLFIPPEKISRLSRLLAIIFFALFFLVFGDLTSVSGFFVGAVLGLVAGFAALSAPRFIVRILKQRRLIRFNQQLVEALMTMSNALKAGFSIIQAFESVVKEEQNPIAQEFGLFLRQTRIGVRFDDALREMEERVGSDDLTLTIRAIETARQTGGNLTEVFERIAATIRERVRIEGRIRSLTAQGRLQAVVVGAVPLLLLFAMTMLDPKMMIGFMTSGVGISLLVFAGILEIVGALVIRKIVQINV